jgi:site-specific recombinase XerD
MIFKKKTGLEEQIHHFILYKPRSVNMSAEDEECLLRFAKFIGKNDVSEITQHDVKAYIEYMRQNYTGYQVLNQATAIRCLLRYYNFHRNMPKRKVGHPPKVEEITKVKKMVEEGYSYRDIQEKTGLHLSHIHHWVHYKIPKQGSVKPE